MESTILNTEVLEGTTQEVAQEVEKILNTTGLSWDVKKEDLVSVTGLETRNSGIFRNDNDLWLGTTSKKYTPYQNSELVYTIYIASKQLNIRIVGGGENYDGKRVYLLLELPDEFIGNTKIKRYITAVNYHNGGGSVGFGSTNKIETMTSSGNYNCNNFFRLYPDLGKFRHSSSIKQRIQIAINELFNSIKKDNDMMNAFSKMAEVKLENELLAEVMKACYSVDLDNNMSNMSTRQFNKITAVSNIVTQEVKNEQDTVWGLFNGILKSTQITTPKSSNTDDYYMAGQGYNINMKAYTTILDYLAKNDAI
jgi:Domain of unknown function (DUF932)